MNPPTHPSHHIPPAIRERLRSLSSAAETLRQLHPEQRELIYQHQWFNLFVPVYLGGLGLSLPAGLQLEETLAWVDGSLGWTVTLCGGANFFAGFLEPDVANELFSNPKICLAGSGHASGTAKKIPAGYNINGRWKYATGAPHATIFTMVCTLEPDGERPATMGDSSTTGVFWLYKDEVTIHEDWNTNGMIATASHSFEVNDLTVPGNRHFAIDPAYAKLPEPIFQYPFLQFAEATLAVNIAGMAIHFSDLAKALPARNQQTVMLIATWEKKLERIRKLFYNTVKRSWDELIVDHSIHPETLRLVSSNSRLLADTARQVVDEIYPHCGMLAAVPAMEINRVWRDLHTAIQHSLLRK